MADQDYWMNRFRLPPVPREFSAWASACDKWQFEHILRDLVPTAMASIEGQPERMFVGDALALSEAERRVLSQEQWIAILWIACAVPDANEAIEACRKRLPPRRMAPPAKKKRARK